MVKKTQAAYNETLELIQAKKTFDEELIKQPELTGQFYLIKQRRIK